MFTETFFTFDWSSRYVCIESHKRLVNVLLRMCVLNTADDSDARNVNSQASEGSVVTHGLLTTKMKVV